MRRAEQLHEEILAQMDLSKEASDEELLELIHRILEEKSKEEFIPLGEKAILGRELFNAFRKLDILQELIEDEEITEIMINGTQPIFIERNGRIYETDKKFLSKGKLEDVVQQMVAGCNRVVNEATPIVDARLEDGSRVNVVLPPVALNGPIVTIRKFPKSRITMETMIDTGSIGKEAAAMLIQAVKAKYNIFISGGTGSGKTTFLNVLSDFIPKEERIITIEDSAELQITGIPNLVRLEARNANVEGTGEINIRDLIRTALRMRPERIIVGEVRGEEALDMLQAFNTGHDGSISTGHANSPDDMMSRLSTMVLMGIKLPLEAVMRQIASGIDILVHLGRLRDKSRKVLEIMEVLGYEKGEIRLQPLFSFQETGSKDGKIQGEWVKRSTLTRTEKLMAAGYQPEGVCPGNNGKHSSGVSDRHAVLFKTMDDGSALKYYERMICQMEEKGKRRFERQFQDALQSLEAQLNVGYSMENAIKEVQRDLQIMYDRHTLIVREFTYMVRQLNLNVTAEAAWKDFAARVALPEVDTFVTVFSLAKRSGGDSILIIKNAVRQLGDKAEVKREIDTVIAAKKMEFQIMSVIPLGIIGYMRLSFPEFMAGLYGNLPGAAFMSICLGAYIAAWRLGCKIVEIEV